MNDLTDLRIFIASLLRPIINEAIKENLEAAKKNIKDIPISQSDNSDLLSYKQAAEYTNYSIKSLYGKVHFHTVPHFKNESGRVSFSRKELLEWLRSGKKKTKAEIEQDADNYVALKK